MLGDIFQAEGGGLELNCSKCFLFESHYLILR
jgi:hypothetical protein